jgi:peptidoglycan/LPS O-acetylase OafA/YrhL/cellulose synthase/poly-beta-1,6-N-acetylglucosamine synthase-like glycosyltransferase
MSLAQIPFTARPLIPETPAGQRLPAPPNDDEKWWYFGRQHRWLLVVQATSFGLIAWSVLRFSTADLRLLLFLAPMTLYGVTLGVSLVSGTHRRRMTRVEHQGKVASWSPSNYPSIDVFLPTAGEPLEILANTYRHVAALEWPGDITVWVLDDSGRDEVRSLSRSYGLSYRSRPNRGELKKAGNLRYGYENSAGDLILILDADFAPRSDMVRELAPYFDDDAVGIVQSPQYFSTRDPSMGWLQRCAGATQELFYRFIQPSRDAVGAAICVGTCAIYRRQALEAAGGFAQIGHSEDVHTGVKLLRAGFGLRYVPVVLARGLCPDQLSAFVNQQYRWCTGSMSLLANRDFHESPAIDNRQRVCFWAGFLYYISTAVNALIAPLPALAMVWLLPRWVEPMNSIWLVGALVLWFVVLPLVMKGRWRFDVLRVQYLYSFAHLAAIAHVITGRTRGWVATGVATSATPLAVSITRLVKTHVVLTQVALWAGIAHGIAVLGIDAYWVMVLFGALGTFIQLPLLFMSSGVRHPKTRVETTNPPPSSEVDPAVPVQGFSGFSPAEPSTRLGRTATVVARPTSAEPHGTAPGARRFRPDIQGLRAVAVTLVVLYHAEVPGITAGYVGVDVFFVISGFLITGQLLRQVARDGKVSLSSFYVGRIRRLLPPALIVVAATVVAARMWDSVFHVRSVSTDALWTLAYGINFHLAAEGVDYQNANGPVSPLQHMWSLAVEEQFYLVWPLLIGMCAWSGGRYRMRLIAGVLVALVAASLYLSVEQTSSSPTYAYFGSHTRAWELAVGALVAMAAPWLSGLRRSISTVLSWAGLAAILAAAVIYNDDTAFPGTAALLPVLGACAVVAAGCGSRPSGAERVLGVGVMQGIGQVSYGWYLWHWPMVVLIPLAVGRELSPIYLVEISALALWFAVLTRHLVENPALRSRLRPRTWAAMGISWSGLVAVGSAAVVLSLPAFVGTGARAETISLKKADTAAVQQALIDGLALSEAPRNLRPSIQAAAEDQPASTSDGCHLDFLKVAQGACVYGDPSGTKTMVLFGDSHAQQWLPALDRQGKASGWRVVSWTKAACSVADIDVYNSALKREFSECMEWREWTFQRIKKLSPDLVVVSQSDAVPGDLGNIEWAEGTSRTMAYLRGFGLPVAYLLDTPLPIGNVPECLATHLDDVGACNALVPDTNPFDDRKDMVAESLTSLGVPTVDPEPWLCTAKECPVIVGNVLVYRDDSHVSARFSRWLAPMTSPLFADKVAGAGQ